jgi:hypothetical protein
MPRIFDSIRLARHFFFPEVHGDPDYHLGTKGRVCSNLLNYGGRDCEARNDGGMWKT